MAGGYLQDVVTRIVNVQWGNLYLVVRFSGGNNTFSFGPYPAPGAGAPSISSGENKLNVEPLDSFADPNGNNATSGFLNCFAYSPAALGAQEAWVLWHTTGVAASTFAAVNNECPWPGGGDVPENTAIAHVNFQESGTAAKDYLYSIPAGDGLVTITVGGILAASDTGLDTSSYSQTIMSGGGTLQVLVFSRVKDKVTQLSDLLNYGSDDSQKATEDDGCMLGLTSDNQGNFLVNVRLDEDPAHAQIDNYGVTFQPYKVTLDPSTGVVDQVPVQPPLRLDS